MASYDQMYGELHGTMIAPKKRVAVPVTHPTKGTPVPGAKPGVTYGAPGTAPVGSVTPPLPPGSLGIPDLPPDIEATVAQILAGDPENGTARALAYIRGTEWYKVTYAGIAQGIRAGVISGEADYRSWRSQVNDTFSRIYGRTPTQDELVGYLGAGYTPGVVEQIGGGHAWAAANAPEAQYQFGAFGGGRLSDEELQTLGEQNVGRTSSMGAAFQQRLNQAQAKMERIFSGTLAQPNFNVGSTGLAASSLQGRGRTDIAR